MYKTPCINLTCSLTELYSRLWKERRWFYVVDLDASEPDLWLALIQAFNSRPEGPLRIWESLAFITTRKCLIKWLIDSSRKQRNSISPFSLDVDQLRVKTGEALAVSPALPLHTFLASDSDMRNNNGHSLSGDSASSLPLSNSGKIDRFLNAIWGLSPKIMVVTEQDSDHNGSTLMDYSNQSTRMQHCLIAWKTKFQEHLKIGSKWRKCNLERRSRTS